MMPTNTATFENKQQELTAFDASNHPLHVQALFDDELDITCARIIYIISCTKSKKLFSARGIAKMVKREKSWTAECINKLLKAGYLIKDSKNNYYLNSAICMSEVSAIPDDTVRNTGRKCPVNLTEVSSKPDNNIINNTIKNTVKNEGTPSGSLSLPDLKHIVLTEQETNLGSGRLVVQGYPFLALTLSEAIQLDKSLARVKIGDISTVLLAANAIGESSESRKHISRSFNYITSAIDERTKAYRNNGENTPSTAKPGGSSLSSARIFKATKKEAPNEEQKNLARSLVSDLVKKM